MSICLGVCILVFNVLKYLYNVFQETQLTECPICAKVVRHLFHHLSRVHKVTNAKVRMVLMHADLNQPDPFNRNCIQHSLATCRNGRAIQLSRGLNYETAFTECVAVAVFDFSSVYMIFSFSGL